MIRIRCIKAPWLPYWVNYFGLYTWPEPGEIYKAEGMYTTKHTPTGLGYCIPDIDRDNWAAILWDVENFEEIDEAEVVETEKRPILQLENA